MRKFFFLLNNRFAVFALALSVIASMALPVSGIAQTSVSPKPLPSGASARRVAQNDKAKTKAKWRLDISKSKPYTVSLTAKDAPLADIALELARKLNAPVDMSPLVKRQKVTLALKRIDLETMLRALAPQAFVEYLFIGGDAQPQKLMAIYLYAYNESLPVESVALKNGTYAAVIAGEQYIGDDDEPVKEVKPSERSMEVDYKSESSQLTVKAKNQSAAVLLYEIASKMNVPFELQYEVDENVNVNFDSYPLDLAIGQLPKLARFYARTDLQTMQITPLRLIMANPENKSN